MKRHATIHHRSAAVARKGTVMVQCLSRLTPAFTGCWDGRIHSIFQRVVNAEMVRGGVVRLLSLVLPGLAAVPDSVCVPPAALRSVQLGQRVLLKPGALIVENQTYLLTADASFRGCIQAMPGKPRVTEFCRLTHGIKNGFDLLPTRARARAHQALASGRWQSCIGLGCGLTPSFDDACVGMMAVFQALGLQAPVIQDLSVTTDVSARYLRLAQEGFFGQAVLDVVEALWHSQANLQGAIDGLLEVGATSGADMLYGMRFALTWGAKPDHTGLQE